MPNKISPCTEPKMCKKQGKYCYGECMRFNHDLPNLLSKKFYDLRKNHKKTLKQISQKSGFSIPYLSEIERGITRPSVKAIAILADVYGLTLSNFFNGITF